MPSVSSTTNRQHDHIAHRVKMVMWERGKEWYGWGGQRRGDQRSSHINHTKIPSAALEGFQIHRFDPQARYFTLTTPPKPDSMYHLWQFSKISWQKVRSNKRKRREMRLFQSIQSKLLVKLHLYQKLFSQRFYHLRRKLRRMLIGKGFEWLINFRLESYRLVDNSGCSQVHHFCALLITNQKGIKFKCQT